jgi:hypothetical protein
VFAIFKKGLVFGAGFSISVLCAVYIFMFSGYFESKTIEKSHLEKIISLENKTLEEQINLATAIYVTKYEESNSDFVKCVVTEVLKSSNKEGENYKVGDLYNEQGYYKGGNVVYGDGVIVFYFGNHGSQKSSYSYSENRVGGLNGITLELLREKVGH